MQVSEVTGQSWKFHFSPAFDPKIKQFILTHRFPNATLRCQDESFRWAKLLRKSGIEAEVHHGFYYPSKDLENPEGHTWLEVQGAIFDPTAAQFDDAGDGEYETHEIE